MVGNQLFGEKYIENKHLWNNELPRWSFVDFFHSFLIVFRVLCGEWIESMWDCLNVAGWFCLPFFIVTMIIGNLVVLNLFLALLLSSFGSNKLKTTNNEEDMEINGVNESFARIKRFFIIIFSKICCLKKQYKKTEEITTDKTYDNGLELNNTKITSQNPEGGQQVTSSNCFFTPILTRNILLAHWAEFRSKTRNLIKNRYFESFIILMIILSSIVLAMEDKSIDTKPTLKKVINISDKLFTLIFLIELIIKLSALGFRNFFTNGWCVLDLLIVAVSTLSLRI